jgi:hypothetical protein
MDDSLQECLKFHHPFTMTIAGPTMVGKTRLLSDLLRQSSRLIVPPPERIVWMYGEWQPMYREMENELKGIISFVRGWDASIYETFVPSENNLLVLDDVMTASKNDSVLSDLFTKGASHRNLSVVLILQNLYFQGKSAVDVRRNTQYMIIFKARQDKLQVARLGRTIFPDNLSYFSEAYKDATLADHGHLLIDLKPTCPEPYCLRSRVLDENVVVYVPSDR